MGNNLLISEPPLQVLPSLARLIGLNEAIILQQVHYWLQRSNNVKDGHKWVYNSYPNWFKQMPLWKSEATMRTAFKHLEDKGLLITANYNKAGFDKTKWYRIDYDKLSSLEIKARSAKNWQTMSQNLADGSAKNWQTNTIDYTENTTETTTYSRAEHDKAKSEREEIIDYLNEKTGSHFKPTTKSTKEHINARLNEGYTVDDFKKVVDIKCADWLHDSRMSQFLRPITLFNTKFESYLNQQPKAMTMEEERDGHFG